MTHLNAEQVQKHTMADSVRELAQRKAFFEDEDTYPPAA